MLNVPVNFFQSCWDDSLGHSKLLGTIIYKSHNIENTNLSSERGGMVVNTADYGSRCRGFEPHSGCRVVSPSKTFLPQKGTGNTQEAVAPSQHD